MSAFCLASFFEEALRDDVGNVLARDADLLEAVLHAPHGLGDELEARVVEEALLHAGHEAEPRARADLADLAQEVEVEDQLLLLAGAEEVEQLVDDEQQPMVRIDLLERPHHADEQVLVVRDLVRGRELVRDAQCLQVLLELGADDVAKRHHDRADLGADDLEAPGDGAGLLSRPSRDGGSWRDRRARRAPESTDMRCDLPVP